jgi:hypothetical protein
MYHVLLTQEREGGTRKTLSIASAHKSFNFVGEKQCSKYRPFYRDSGLTDKVTAYWPSLSPEPIYQSDSRFISRQSCTIELYISSNFLFLLIQRQRIKVTLLSNTPMLFLQQILDFLVPELRIYKKASQ